MITDVLRQALAAATMAEANAVLDGCGVEHVAVCGRELDYVNMGDTYDLTVCEEDGRRWIGTWGDWLEDAEDRHCRDNDEIRCAYCGEFTPLCEAAKLEPEGSRPSWRLTVCEHCGRGVDGERKAEPENTCLGETNGKD